MFECKLSNIVCDWYQTGKIINLNSYSRQNYIVYNSDNAGIVFTRIKYWEYIFVPGNYEISSSLIDNNIHFSEHFIRNRFFGGSCVFCFCCWNRMSYFKNIIFSSINDRTAFWIGDSTTAAHCGSIV